MRFARRLRNDLDAGAAILLLEGEPATVIHQGDLMHKFCKLLRSAERDQQLIEEICNEAPGETPLRTWLKEFKPSSDLAARLGEQQDALDRIFEANQSSADAVRRLDSFAYPLTLVGMVLSVFSIGHLLRSQAAENSSDETNMSSEATSLVTRSLILVLALSTLDLVWTILASEAGQMRELNPLGSHLIGSPIALIAFKAAMTCSAAGLLFGLRHYRRAQVGAWWACLICTLLTLRWLVLNSLFIA